MMIRAAILAGGQASRMGGAPKGLLQVGGRRILDRLVEVMIAAFGVPPLLVANAPDAASWRPDLTVVPDLVSGAGTLGGLLTAISWAPAPVVCVAWDMPFVPAPLLVRLGAELAGADAVLPTSGGPRGIEPLCAGYGPACAEPIRRAIERDDLRAIAFHAAVTIRLVDPTPFGDPARLFFNVNDAEDLARADRWAR